MTRTDNVNVYRGKHVHIVFAPLRLVPPEPTSKVELILLALEASDEVRHAVNTWLYSQ